jgi:catechol 2,3-dioxygenase-like lactoylglutathione lyase family enzyme
MKENAMLGRKSAVATLAVKDLEAARKFYEGVVGLKPSDQQEPGVVAYDTSGARLFVYPSKFAGTNEGTAVTWVVGDELEQILGALKAKGVAFEHYDLPEVTRQGDIHIAGSKRIAWFKDPDGNIHAVTSG